MTWSIFREADIGVNECRTNKRRARGQDSFIRYAQRFVDTEFP